MSMSCIEKNLVLTALHIISSWNEHENVNDDWRQIGYWQYNVILSPFIRWTKDYPCWARTFFDSELIIITHQEWIIKIFWWAFERLVLLIMTLPLCRFRIISWDSFQSISIITKTQYVEMYCSNNISFIHLQFMRC